MPMYDYKCCACEITWTELRPYDERDNIEEACLMCGETKDIKRVYLKMPGITKASYVDGQRRNNKYIKDLKEKAKLEIERADTVNRETRREIDKEINKLQKL